MAITDQEKGVWDIDQVYNKINEGGIWTYNAPADPATFGWGSGAYGQLGQNDRTSRSSPTQIGGDAFSYISSTSSLNVLGTRSDGSLWGWGGTAMGRLGLNEGPGTYYSSPVQLPGTTWSTAENGISASFYNGAALKTDGTLWVMGSNYNGTLGLNQPQTTYYSSPVQLPGTTWSNIGGFVSDCGRAIKTDGTLWVWGRNDNAAQLPGALGLNDTISRSSPTQLPGTWSQCVNIPTATYGIKTNGTLWSWGMNQGGQLGQNQSWPDGSGGYVRISSPTQIGTGTDWSLLPKGTNIGNFFMGAIKTNGTLWTWGRVDNGQLGLNQGGLGPSISSPAQVPGTNWSQVRIRGSGMFASKTDGTLWAWGDNAQGSIGNNTGGSAVANEYSSPVQIPGTWVNSPLHGTGSTLCFANVAGS
jgi:alpha-tubulin suppressor-like RCC1 family protein